MILFVMSVPAHPVCCGDSGDVFADCRVPLQPDRAVRQGRRNSLIALLVIDTSYAVARV